MPQGTDGSLKEFSGFPEAANGKATNGTHKETSGFFKRTIGFLMESNDSLEVTYQTHLSRWIWHPKLSPEGRRGMPNSFEKVGKASQTLLIRLRWCPKLS